MADLETVFVGREGDPSNRVRQAWRAWDEARPYAIVAARVDFRFREETLGRLAAISRRIRQTPYFVGDDDRRERQEDRAAFLDVLDGVFGYHDPGETGAIYAYAAARELASFLRDERPAVAMAEGVASGVDWAKEGI